MRNRSVPLYAGAAGLLFAAAIMNLAARAAPADAGAGKSVFARRCSGCHALEFDKGGPRLRGVFGRKAGTVAGFPYSEALRNSGIVWNESLLDQWLADPNELVKDADMEFRVADAGERAALINYLKSLSR